MARWLPAAAVAALVAVFSGAAGYVAGKYRAPRGAAGRLRHVVVEFFDRPNAPEKVTPDKIREIEEAWRALPSKIPLIERLEWGVDIGPQNYPGVPRRRCFLLTFKDADARDALWQHAAYKELGHISSGHGGHLEVEYVAQERPRDEAR
jgi:hypothetical protein